MTKLPQSLEKERDLMGSEANRDILHFSIGMLSLLILLIGALS